MFKIGVSSLLGVALGLVALHGSTVHAESFDAGCTIPFAGIAQTHPIDSQCGIEGGAFGPGEDTPAHHAQNHAKNNFCASGTPSRVTIFTLKKLQGKADTLKQQGTLVFGSRTTLPDDRSVLKDLVTTTDGNTVGEGSLVVLVGFVAKAKNQGKESVNCSLSSKHEDNDIHIALAGTAGLADLCQSVTAELVPHQRPAAWTVAALNGVTHPVRVTGQLFFDASHKPCVGSTVGGGQPKRESNWEVHPVYQLEVCKNTSLGGCKFDADVWTPLDQVP